MVYVYRTLWLIGVIPVFLFMCLLFGIGLLTYPLVSGIYYNIHETTETMKWEVDTMANFVFKKYSKLKDLLVNEPKDEN